MLDDPTDMVGTALLYLGKNPNSESEADLRLAEDLLMKIRPYIRTIHSSQYIDQLANGELCVVVGYSGDVLQARDRGRGGRQADRHQVLHPEGRRADVVRHAGDPGRCAAPRQCPQAASTTCCGPTLRRPIPTSSITPTPTRRRRRWSASRCATTRASTRRPRSRRGCSRAWPSRPSSLEC